MFAARVFSLPRVLGSGRGRASSAPRAVFKSHFARLRVKRPDTALCEGGKEKRGREDENGRMAGDGGGNNGEDKAERGGGVRGRK